MDTSDPIVTIKLTTDNSQSIENLIQLVIITLVIFNIKLIFSLVSDLSKIVYYSLTTTDSLYVRGGNQRSYVSLD